MGAVRTRRAGGRARRRGSPPATQDALFEVAVRPERRYYRQILDALNRGGFGVDGLESELIISKLFGAVWAGQEGQRDGVVEESFGLGLVDHARELQTPFALAVLRTIAAIAPIREVRESALDGATVLTERGLPDPQWTRPVGAAVPGRCWAFEDIFGDESTVVLEFQHAATDGPADRHALVIYVDRATFSVATDCLLVIDVDTFVRDLRNDAQHGAPMFALRQVDPTWGGALLARAFARTDLIRGIHVEPSFADLRAVAMARISALPSDAAALPAEPDPPPPETRRALVDEFLASPEARGLPDSRSADSVAGRIVDYSCRYDPADLARVSPAKWEVFLLAWLPKHGGLVAAERAALPAVARAWSGWAGRRMMLPATATAELAAALDEVLADADARGTVY